MTTPQTKVDTFSVLIPAHNEEPVISGTLAALAAAGVAPRDIYVVDDCSTDKTAAVARELGVNVFTTPSNCGKARAQLQALEHFDLCGRYDWVIFLDGDTKVDINFYSTVRQAAAETPTAALFVGQVRTLRAKNLISASRAVEYTFGHDVSKIGQNNFNCIFVSPGCASVYRADVLRRLHFDSETLAEDIDLTMQVHRLGGTVIYLHGAQVWTQDPGTFRDYYKQVLRWARGFWQVVKKHRVLGPTKKQRVDVYMAAMALDALLLNRLVWLPVIFFAAPKLGLLALSADAGLVLSIAAYAAYKTRRADVIWKFPGYYWISFINGFAFIKAFFEIMVLRRRILAWNKVKRYDFSAATA